MELHDLRSEELSTTELYGLLRLRSEVFVVEQDCVYLDLDGRDLAPNVRHLWFEHDRRPVAACRLFDEGTEWVIGRVVTASAARGQGLAGALIDRCIATTDGPWRLAAQAYLSEWYQGFGFVPVGEEYLEDGIVHIDMVRPADADRSHRG